MKYMIYVLLAIVVSLILGYLITLTFKKKLKKNVHFKALAFTLIFGLVILVLISVIYFSICYRPGKDALKAMEGNDKVHVEKVDGGYLFDGEGNDTAIIFYGGDKADAKAYAPLMLKLANKGYDCFLADLPLNFAIFNVNWANKFINAYNYDTYIMAGHSMGGIVASAYANENATKIDGIVLLASYPSIKIDDSLKLCSIYGSEDGCLDMGAYESNKENWPKVSIEKIIEGGNHSGFADYGDQKGDYKAIINEVEQQRETVRYIDQFVKPESQDNNLLLYSDDNCDIYYSSFSPSFTKEQTIKLYVDNKTDDTLTFQCKRVLLDDYIYSKILTSDNVYANKKDYVTLKIENCANNSPQTFSADLIYIKDYYQFDGTTKEKTEIEIPKTVISWDIEQ